MKIADVAGRYPEAADVFMAYGLHCVGCHVSALETVGEGAAGHGMPPKEIDEMIAEANKAVAESEASGNKVNLTKRAAEKVGALVKEQGPTAVIRIEPVGRSWSLSIDTDPAKKDDVSVAEKGVNFVYAKKDAAAVEGVKIDFVENVRGASGFRITRQALEKATKPPN